MVVECLDEIGSVEDAIKTGGRSFVCSQCDQCVFLEVEEKYAPFKKDPVMGVIFQLVASLVFPYGWRTDCKRDS